MIFRKSMKSFIFSSSFFDFFQCQLLLQQLKTPSSLVTVWGFLSSQINSRRRGRRIYGGPEGREGPGCRQATESRGFWPPSFQRQSQVKLQIAYSNAAAFSSLRLSLVQILKICSCSAKITA